jgi:hypothetical protein
MARIAVTGSSGLIGAKLRARLGADGHEVVRAFRGNDSDPSAMWDPSAGWMRSGAWEGLDAIVHLAGASIGDARWSEKRKRELTASRIDATRLLVDHLATVQRKPSTFIAASAVGYYGDRGEEELTEASPRGTGFLADLCEAWERESLRARELGMRVVLLRFGVVLSKDGGALKKMLLPFKLGVGGKLGSGKMWMSWIAEDDAVSAITHALATPSLEGPVNAVAMPVRNAEFTKALGAALRRPTVFPVPPPALKLLFGAPLAEELLLASARVLPAKLDSSGFTPAYPEVRGALRRAFGRS